MQGLEIVVPSHGLDSRQEEEHEERVAVRRRLVEKDPREPPQ